MDYRPPKSERKFIDKVIDAIRSVPSHYASLAYVNSQSNTGTCTLTQAGATGVTWNLTSLSISMAGPTIGPNAKLVIYDGAVGGTVIYAQWLPSPGNALVGSVGTIIPIPLPTDAVGRPGIQATPGNAMNIQVTGTGSNQVSINARFTDGILTAI